MANKSSKGARVNREHPDNQLRKSVYTITSEMEEPLRHASQMVRLIGLVDPTDGEDMEAIGFIAHEAGTRLQAVAERLRALFEVCTT